MSQIVASLIAMIGADTTGLEKGTRKTKEELEKSAEYARKYGVTSDEMVAKNAAMLTSIATVAIGVGAAINDVVNDQIEYADSVRELALIGDTSTESASRFIQVLDDYKISAEDATAASRALKEKGLVPTVETLAKLSDAYLKINDPAERMTFIQENLGRGGTKWIEVLNKGSAALLKQNEGIADNLVLTQKMVDQAREAQIATDTWNDSVTGLKTTFAVELLPTLTGVVNHYNDIVTSLQENGYWYTLLHQGNLQEISDRREQATALMLSTGEMEKNTESAAEAAAAVEAQAEALKTLSSANADSLNGMMNVQKGMDDYAAKQQELGDKAAELQDEKAGLYDWETEKIGEIDGKLEDIKAQYEENQAAYRTAMEERFTLMAIEKIAMIDGIAGYSEAEMAMAEAMLKSSGMVSEGAASEQLAMERLTTAVATKQISLTDYGKILDDVMADGVVAIDEVNRAIDELPDEKTITLNIVTVGGMGTFEAPELAMRGRSAGVKQHASGGDFMIPMSYGNEGFKMGNGDTASGGERVSITSRNQSRTENMAAIFARIPTAQDNAKALGRELMKLGIGVSR